MLSSGRNRFGSGQIRVSLNSFELDSGRVLLLGQTSTALIKIAYFILAEVYTTYVNLKNFVTKIALILTSFCIMDPLCLR